MYLYDYAILFALREEFLQFVKALCVYKCEASTDANERHSDYFACYKDYENISEIDEEITIKNKKFKIFATIQRHPGMVSASICTSRLIREFRPKHIVLLGIAAGFEGREFGSPLIADYVFVYQQGKLKNGKFEPDGIGLKIDERLRHRLYIHKDDIAQSVRDAVYKNLDHPGLDLNVGQIEKIGAFLGPMATSIQVVADKKEENRIKQTTRKVIGLEMEGFGLFQTVAESDSDPKPLPILIKSLCDHAMSDKTDEYHALAGFTSAYFFLKFLETETEEPVQRIDKSYATFIPFSYQTERKIRYKQIIRDAPENSEVCFISITTESDLATPPTSGIDRSYLETAFRRGVRFRGIVVNPRGNEAFFRNDIESPRKELQKTILWQGAERVIESLKDELKDKDIEMRYARVGIQFKLWMSDEAALIEPYHFGREPDKIRSGLCGFSQVAYKKQDKEYQIIKDHFQKLWERSDPFWPESKRVEPWNSKGKAKTSIATKSPPDTIE